MKKRKFLGLIAILFVAIFALSCCFFAACKNEEEENPEPTPELEGENENSDNDDTKADSGRTGSTLTGEEEIIGTWTGDVEISATVYGIGGTIDAVMTADIAASGFTLVFTPTAIDLGIFSDIAGPYLEQVGIAVGEEFEMFANMPIYLDESGYFVDIDGKYFKCQVPVSIVDGLLCISFDEPMTFDSLSIDIVFEAKLYSASELAIEKIIDLPASGEVGYTTIELGDGTTATFENNKNLSIRTTDGVNYAVSGTASTMGEAEAKYYDSADIQEGAPYVVLKIAVEKGGSVYFGYTGKTYVNDDESDYTGDKTAVNGYADEFEDDGYIYVIQALLDEDGDGIFDSREFTVTSAEGEVTNCTITFGDVEILTVTVTLNVESATVKIGSGVYTVTATVVMSDGSTYGGDYTWTSSDDTVATVAQGTVFKYRGNVTAVSTGTATITVTLDTGDSASCTITVEEAAAVESVTISSDGSSVAVGGTLTLTANVTMADGSSYGGGYTWTSSNDSVATVAGGQLLKSRGTVTGVAEGSVTITVTLDTGDSAAYSITVVAAENAS